MSDSVEVFEAVCLLMEHAKKTIKAREEGVALLPSKESAERLKSALSIVHTKYHKPEGR